MAPTEIAPAPPIGGFFETHAPPGAETCDSVFAVWTGGRPHGAFVSARAAFAALLRARPGATAWLPAFVCADLVDPAFAGRVRFYPVHDGFAPDLSGVEARACPGDVVVAVAHFGLPVAPAAGDLAARRPDLTLVEDRAQALDAGPPAPGAWTLFSPRKLLGVADGGLLVAPDGAAEVPQPTDAPDAQGLWRAPDLRAADPAGRDNVLWHAANQARERAMGAGAAAMTGRSLDILRRTPLAPLAARRLANWRRLDADLKRWSALPTAGATPPLGYVLRLAPEARARLLAALHAERIFAAVHWPALAAPAQDFPRESGWTHELATLPCDHRYGEAEMARIAACVREALA